MYYIFLSITVYWCDLDSKSRFYYNLDINGGKMANPGPLRKKLRRFKDEAISIVDPKPSPLTQLPYELLAEILLYTASPKDLLAVARCSKYFCDTLVQNQSSYFIWRSVRATCKLGPIPDPTPNFQEPSYAAYLFDGGECDVNGTS